MTDRKHLKARVRARMAHTGERYAAARAHVIAAGRPTAVDATPPSLISRDVADGAVGVNPGSSALRALLTHAGLPVSEPLASIIGGGIGIGVFQFHYAKEDIGTFFLAGRHRWDDDVAYLRGALERLGLESIVTETTSPRTAERHLREALADGGPVVAWVDAAELGTRAYPPVWSGGGYHVIVVRGIDDDRGVVVFDDLTASSFELGLDVLARARARIRTQRHRLLRLTPGAATPTTETVRRAVRDGSRATVAGFDAPRTRSFSLDALGDWSGRLRGTGKDGWATVFPAGGRLWDALAAVHLDIAHYGSGGGLGRPQFAAGLGEAAGSLGDDRLRAVADRYLAVGRAWAELGSAALPDAVPSLRRTRQLQDERAAVYASRGPAGIAELTTSWEASATIRAEVDARFPLERPQVDALLRELADRVDAIRADELQALDDLRSAVA